MNAFIEYSWPGNIRELQNVVERSVIVSSATEKKIEGTTTWHCCGSGLKEESIVMTTFDSFMGSSRLQWDLELDCGLARRDSQDQVEDHGKGD